MPRPIQATIHPDALRHNLARCRQHAPDAKAWAIVKANAYGHGIERAYAGLRGADGFALLDLDESCFLAALRKQFGRRLDFVASGPRASFPLALRVRQHLVGTRQAWIGNAAQSLHPVSGQGFNLGLRDAWELASALLASDGEAGDGRTLAAYAAGRELDRKASIAFTDGIVRIFGNDLAPLRAARGAGLLALDLVPPLRHFVARRMIWGARAWP